MGNYVSIKPTPDSARQLYDFVKSSPIPRTFPQKEYHITLAYSKEGFNYTPSDELNGIQVCPMGWEVFGDDQKVLVLKVTHPALQKRADGLAAQGYKSKFPQYRAHITVGMADDVEHEHLPIPNFNITLDRELGKPLSDDSSYDPASKCEQNLPTFKEFVSNL